METVKISGINLMVAVAINLCVHLYVLLMLRLPYDIFGSSLQALAGVLMSLAFIGLIGKYRRRAVYPLLLLLAGFAIAGIFLGWYGYAASYINDYFVWLYDYLSGFDRLNTEFAAATSIAVITTVSLISTIFICISPNILVTATYIIMLFAIPNDIPRDFAYTFVYVTLFFSMTVFCINIIFFKRNYLLKMDGAATLGYGTYGIIIAMLVFVIAWFMPVNENPAWFTSINTNIDAFISWYSFGRTGAFSFSNRKDKDRLGGPVDTSADIIMHVVADKPVYLYGAVYDQYTGSNWTVSEKSYYSIADSTDKMMLDTQKTKFTLDIFNNYPLSYKGDRLLSDMDPDGKIFEMTSIEIKYSELRTRTVFLPLKTEGYTLPQNIADRLLVNDNGILYMNRFNPRGMSYTVEAMIPDYKSPALIIMMQESEYMSRVASGMSSEAFIRDSDKELSKFLALPAELPRSIRRLAVELTAEHNSVYDKAKAVEKHLSTAYRYRLDMPSLGMDEDFVESFLFDLKEGYCTYFASAMAVMLRSVGIPTRYAEGYILSEDSKDGENTYLITNRQAHAWVDVYIKGFGWIPFEPTSAYNYSFYNEPTYGTDRMYQDYIDEYYEQHQGYGANRFGTEASVENDSVVAEAEPMEESFSEKHRAPISAAVVVLLVLFALALNYERHKRRIREAKRQGNSEVIRYYYMRMLTLLELYRLKPETDESTRQFAERIRRHFPIPDVNFVMATSLFEKARYSNGVCSETERRIMAEELVRIVNGIEKELEPKRVFVEKYLKGNLLY